MFTRFTSVTSGALFRDAVHNQSDVPRFAFRWVCPAVLRRRRGAVVRNKGEGRFRPDSLARDSTLQAPIDTHLATPPPLFTTFTMFTPFVAGNLSLPYLPARVSGLIGHPGTGWVSGSSQNCSFLDLFSGHKVHMSRKPSYMGGRIHCPFHRRQRACEFAVAA